METEEDTPRMINVKLPRKYHRDLRRLAAEHELANAEIVMWALDLLFAYARDGGVYAPR